MAGARVGETNGGWCTLICRFKKLAFLNVATGSLSYPGLPASIGNSVTNGGAGLGPVGRDDGDARLGQAGAGLLGGDRGGQKEDAGQGRRTEAERGEGWPSHGWAPGRE